MCMNERCLYIETSRVKGLLDQDSQYITFTTACFRFTVSKCIRYRKMVVRLACLAYLDRYARLETWQLCPLVGQVCDGCCGRQSRDAQRETSQYNIYVTIICLTSCSFPQVQLRFLPKSLILSICKLLNCWSTHSILLHFHYLDTFLFQNVCHLSSGSFHHTGAGRQLSDGSYYYRRRRSKWHKGKLGAVCLLVPKLTRS